MRRTGFNPDTGVPLCIDQLGRCMQDTDGDGNCANCASWGTIPKVAPKPVYSIRVAVLKDGVPLCYMEEMQNEYRTGMLDASCIDSEGVRHHVHARYNYGQA